MAEGAILVGDAGGTNVRFALAREIGGRILLSDLWKRAGADYLTFEAAVSAYLSELKPKLLGASFGMAGAVQRNRVELLHRGWTVDGDQLKEKLGVASMVMVNDFFAMARSAPDIPSADIHELSPGETDPEGSLVVGGPGTGFGIAIVRRFSGGWIVVGGEGGHQVFAPQTNIEWRLAERLRARLGYVSNEIVASGSGFEVALEAMFAVMGVAPRKLSQAEVIEEARSGDAVCLEFCRLRARTVMTAMGDMAQAAIERFRQRGARTGLVAPIPLKLIVSEEAPLLGAAKLWLDVQARGWL